VQRKYEGLKTFFQKTQKFSDSEKIWQLIFFQQKKIPKIPKPEIQKNFFFENQIWMGEFFFKMVIF